MLPTRNIYCQKLSLVSLYTITIYLANYFIRATHTDKSFAEYNIFWETHRAPEDAPGENLGGNFVDVSLRVIVRGAADTLCAFKPGYLHGTTVASPSVHRSGIVVAFSKHILDSFLQALEKAGEGGIIPIYSRHKEMRDKGKQVGLSVKMKGEEEEN